MWGWAAGRNWRKLDEPLTQYPGLSPSLLLGGGGGGLKSTDWNPSADSSEPLTRMEGKFIYVMSSEEMGWLPGI